MIYTDRIKTCSIHTLKLKQSTEFKKKMQKKGKTAKQRDKNNSFELTEHVTFRKEKREQMKQAISFSGPAFKNKQSWLGFC